MWAPLGLYSLYLQAISAYRPAGTERRGTRSSSRQPHYKDKTTFLRANRAPEPGLAIRHRASNGFESPRRRSVLPKCPGCLVLGAGIPSLDKLIAPSACRCAATGAAVLGITNERRDSRCRFVRSWVAASIVECSD